MNNYNEDGCNNHFSSSSTRTDSAVASDEGVCLFGASEEYDGLPPADFLFPTREEEALRQSVEYCANEFDKVCLYPEDAYYYLSHSCAKLAGIAAKRRAERISSELCDRLTKSIIAARLVVVPRAPDLGASVLVRGFDGLFVLAVHLSETDAQRTARHPDVVRDAFAQVRIMRNCAHNECLAKDVAARADRRRTEAVADIIETAKRLA